jgi:hypothetical protein
MKWAMVGLFVASWLCMISLMQHLANFRKDRRVPAPAVGTPYLNFRDTVNRENYTPQGARLLPWVFACWLVMAVSFFTSLALMF